MSNELRKEIDGMKLKEICTTAVNSIGGVSDRAINVGILYQLTALNNNIMKLLQAQEISQEIKVNLDTQESKTVIKTANADNTKKK